MQILNNDFIIKFRTMIDARLIWYKHYFLFCDEIIERSNKPPYWIIELSVVKHPGNALNIINQYLNTNNEKYEGIDVNDLFIAALFLRYERKELSWATFLKEAGEYSDSCGGKNECEYFYYMLNDLEDNEFHIRFEQKQCIEISLEYNIEINEMKEQYKVFIPYFKSYN